MAVCWSGPGQGEGRESKEGEEKQEKSPVSPDTRPTTTSSRASSAMYRLIKLSTIEKVRRRTQDVDNRAQKQQTGKKKRTWASNAALEESRTSVTRDAKGAAEDAAGEALATDGQGIALRPLAARPKARERIIRLDVWALSAEEVPEGCGGGKRRSARYC